MASNINPFNIDGTFPIAGQDNSSQGFRDNFTNIRNNLSYTKSEIEDLQNKAILKAALTGSTVSNDMAGTVLYKPTLKSSYEALYDLGQVSGEVAIDYDNSAFQKVTTGGDITLSFAQTSWPQTGVLGRITVWVSVAESTHTVSFPITSPGVTIGTSDIAGYAAGTISFDVTGDYLLEFSSIDAGNNIMIRDLSRAYATLRGTDFYHNPIVSDTTFVGYNLGLPTGVSQIESAGVNQISALGGYNAVTVGNLAQANVTYRYTDQGPQAGYSVTGVRGNIIANTTFTEFNAVASNDMLGHVNALAFTGNGAGNVITEVSTINFAATGSNVTYGLGGNISVFTKTDGGAVAQALGIENDQSVKFYGNTIIKQATPTGPTAIGVAGQISSDANYIYICVATNTWKRVAITSAGW